MQSEGQLVSLGIGQLLSHRRLQRSTRIAESETLQGKKEQRRKYFRKKRIENTIGRGRALASFLKNSGTGEC